MRGVCDLRMGPGRDIGKAGDPVVVFRLLVRPGQGHQQHHRLGPRGGEVQVLLIGDSLNQAQGGQGVRSPGSFPLESRSCRQSARQQDQGTEQGKNPFFHGIPPNSGYIRCESDIC